MRLDGFHEIVERAWGCNTGDVDVYRTLDIKFRQTAKALKSWSRRSVGSVRCQLFMAREVISQLDVAQERHDLTDDEYALRAELKRHSLGLASMARTIARHRSRIRFLGEGDANTKYFHLQACHRSRKNFIPMVQHEGRWFSDEEAKADLIFEYYNDILGKPFRREHSLHLHDLLPQLDLTGLDTCFSEDEIWVTIKELPSDRAPRPDGFTGLFYKVAWQTIKRDIVNAFNALWSLDARSFNLLNEAMMILLRKTEAPTRLKDYRPISLMHSFSKLFAKCLARRLALRLKEIVVMNQSAFIKDRSIHDNYRSVQLACRWLNCKRFSSLLLKVGIAKEFDSVAWPFLFEVLRHISFSRRWIDWISMLLSTASTKVLDNGSTGRRIAHARGLRQGDPISPMLFVIVMEVLNWRIKEAHRRRVLLPFLGGVIAHRASLYADDLVMLVAPKPQDLDCLRRILMLFAGASGLVTNVEKCVMSPIRCDDAVVAEAQQAFPCALAPFPSKYLGIPLSLRRLRRVEEQPLIDSVAARIYQRGRLGYSPTLAAPF